MITLKNSREQQFNIWWREFNLKLTKHCLEKYKETRLEFYLDNAKFFGQLSKTIKEKYL